MNSDSVYKANSERRNTESPWPVAVIDVGTTSLRMQVAEILPDGSIRRLESFSQAVSLGKDSFMSGEIKRETIEDCVHVLRIYRERLQEYGITDSRQIRVIATSAVKEARNRLAFQDRIYIATGFEIEPLDESELHRVTYLGMLPLIEANPLLSGISVICEVSGGSTETLILKQNDVLFSQTHRLGSLRLRKRVESYDTTDSHALSLLKGQIDRRVSRMMENFGKLAPAFYMPPDAMIALGGDIRFAAKEIQSKAVGDRLFEVDLEKLQEFTSGILSRPVSQLATQYHFSLTDAGTLGPALLAYCSIAKRLGLSSFYVAEFNLRDGLVQELAGRGRWNLSVQNQISRSAIQLGRRFQFDEAHAVKVAQMSCALFEQLQELHGLDDRFLGILEMAALLHEIGLFVNVRSYHKHSLYLIRNSEFFGIGDRDVELVSLVARYHRRAAPQPSHLYYSQLTRADRVAVAKLAAILRIAKALDATRSQAVEEIQCDVVASEVSIQATTDKDVSVEQLELKSNRSLFRSIFGLRVTLNAPN